jgi:ankyrin repeat protein
MTNEWPLTFFYIRENSKIYLEFIQVIDKVYRKLTKTEEIQKKALTNAKSKYYKQLGFFQHLAPKLGVIPESQNEYNDEFFKKKNTCVSSSSFTKEEVGDLLMNAVKNNNIQQFRELMDQYDSFDINSLQNNGWNLLQYVCLNGFTEIAVELVTKHNADVNIPNIDGWTPLHLASYKGHAEIVKVLMSDESLDINCSVPGIGTPLHCACKKNHLQVVSLLLHKANFKYTNFNIEFLTVMVTYPLVLQPIRILKNLLLNLNSLEGRNFQKRKKLKILINIASLKYLNIPHQDLQKPLDILRRWAN